MNDHAHILRDVSTQQGQKPMTCSVRSPMRAFVFTAIATTGAFAQTATTAAPAKKALSISDYTRWRSIDGAQLSDDAKWLSFGYRFTNTPQADSKPVLHIRNVATSQETEIANATSASFSDDSKWIVYTVDVPQAGGRGGRGGAGNGQGATGAGGGAGAPPADSGRG